MSKARELLEQIMQAGPVMPERRKKTCEHEWRPETPPIGWRRPGARLEPSSVVARCRHCGARRTL